jgi:hypothetical protein
MTDRVVAVINPLGSEYKNARTVEEIVKKLELVFDGDALLCIVPADKSFTLPASVSLEPNMDWPRTSKRL